MTTETKVCPTCNKRKPLTDFYLIRRGGTKRRTYCKTCDNDRTRPDKPSRLIRQRARHRAVADLIATHPDEFDRMFEVQLAWALEEAAELARKVEGAVIRLRPGKRRDGQRASDRMDVARCVHCRRHHDRGHVCPFCGCEPTSRRPKIEPEERPPLASPAAHEKRVRAREETEEAIRDFNRGTARARRADKEYQK